MNNAPLPRILFLDQSGKPGGAELCLLDIARFYRDRCQVCLFTDGAFREMLEAQQIPVQVLSQQEIRVRKESGWLAGLTSVRRLLPMAIAVARLSRNYHLIYANTQKALVIGALASLLSRRPLLYHLHDILSPEHFSTTNRRLAVTLANRFASQVIATSVAARTAFIAAGGRSDFAHVVYNGFDPQQYEGNPEASHPLRQQLQLDGKFVVGHFSRLSPWKGQHILLDALTHCSEDVVALFVGDALYGEQDYAQQLQAQVAALNLQTRTRFLGYRTDVVPLMQTCDVITHTSTVAEPFGRVIVEAMLCDRPIIAAEAGGAVEIVETDWTGWLLPPQEPALLAHAIMHCKHHPEQAAAIAHRGRAEASQRFHLKTIHQQIDSIVSQAVCKTFQQNSIEDDYECCLKSTH